VTTLDTNILTTITGGQTASLSGATAEDWARYNQCASEADARSLWHPSTWNRPSKARCRKWLERDAMWSRLLAD
jgi:hypothetical protein